VALATGVSRNRGRFLPATDVDAPASRTSSIFLRRMIGSMFMRVNSKCAHQVRPPSNANYDIRNRERLNSV
jgi:hypothetical protein